MTKPHILVVDSDEGFGSMLKEGLNSSGHYQAVCAYSGREALESVIRTPFDLIIVDMGLRDVSPISLVKAMRRAQNEARIMMIPLMGQQLPEKAKELNINGVLTKPFFVGDLPDLIDRAIGRKKSTGAPAPAPSPARPVVSQPKKPQTTAPASSPEVSPVPTPPVTAAVSPAPASASVPQETLRYLRANEAKILQLLNDLNREVRAEAILFITGEELIAHAGHLSRDECHDLAGLIAQSSQAAAQAAKFLGEKAGRFAQSSHEGAEYRVYTLTLAEGIFLSLALSSNIPLGMIRHQCRQVAQQLSKFI